MIGSQILNNNAEKIQELTTLTTFHSFEESLSEVLKNHLHKNQSLDILNLEEKQMIFALLLRVNYPQRALNTRIYGSDIDKIYAAYQQLTNEFKVEHEGKEISLADFNILASFYHFVYHGIKSRKRARRIKEAYAVPILEGISMLTQLPKMYAACFSMLISRLNDVSKQLYSFEMISKQDGMKIILTPVLSTCLATKESILINRSYRSVYKIANPLVSSEIKWLTIPREQNQKQGHENKSDLNMYIQALALNGLKESLDIFDQEGINAVLNYNFRHLDRLEYYKGNLLLPIRIYNVKIGYLICNIYATNLVARTFNLINKKDTPEGDRLLKDKVHHVTNSAFCQANKLSLLLKLKENEKQEFQHETGLGNIIKLKTYNLNTNAMQEANYEEFLSYIKQGENAELSINNTNREELALQSYSFGKLLQLLIINTIGLVLAQFAKMFFYVIHKMKNLFKRGRNMNARSNKHESAEYANTKLFVSSSYNLVNKKLSNLEEQVIS